MTRFTRIALVFAATAVVWSVLWGQETKLEPATVDERLEKAEGRLVALEKAIAGPPELAGRPQPSALESRLARIEARVERLEAQSLREPAGAPSSGYDRMLESRVRALERQISRLR